MNTILHIVYTLYKYIFFLEITEKHIGRKKKGTSYQARLIDIDILFYNNLIISEKNLSIPHPLIHKRRFTLVPLAEIASELIHPLFRKSIGDLLKNCTDNLEVKKF